MAVDGFWGFLYNQNPDVDPIREPLVYCTMQSHAVCPLSELYCLGAGDKVPQVPQDFPKSQRFKTEDVHCPNIREFCYVVVNC